MFGEIFIITLLILQFFSTTCTAAKNDSKPELRIFDGTKCSIEDFPYVFPLMISDDKDKSGYRRFCGATLVSIDWILTAAHCLKDENKLYTIMVTKGNRVPDTKVHVHVITIYRHPKFNPQTFANDIALASLHRPVILNDYVKIVKLPNKMEHINDYHLVPPCTTGTIMGWGSLDPDNWFTVRSLQCATVPMVPTVDCEKNKMGKIKGKKVDSSQICSISPKGNGACEGDAGGPLFCGDKTQIGIISWGTECERAPGLQVYTRVNFYVDFIHETLREGRSNSGNHKNFTRILLIFFCIFNF